MGLQSIKVVFKKGIHAKDYDKNGYDLLGWYINSFDDFVFILDENMNLVVFDTNNVQIIGNASCYGWDNENTKLSIDLYNKLDEYFKAVSLLKNIVKFDVDDDFNVNKDYLKRHIQYYNDELKNTIEN